jgi:hypothetical protein
VGFLIFLLYRNRLARPLTPMVSRDEHRRPGF